MKHKQTIKNSLIGALCLVGSISTASAALIVNAPISITQEVTIQSIIVSDNDGSNTATAFGTTSQQTIIEGFVNDIWAQAGININFLPSANTWNNSNANNGVDSLSTLTSTGISDGVANSDSNVLNMYFVNVPPSYAAADLTPLTAAGLGFIDFNGIAQFVGSDLFNANVATGLETIASVVSHEIGHNLGLDHIIESQNLLDGSSAGQRLNALQITTALGSAYSIDVTPVPVPPALILFMSGLGLLGFYKRKRA